MHKLLILMGLVSLSTTLSAKTSPAPEGVFNCPISFEERVEISIEPGEDFPSFHGLITPRARTEVLKIEFSKDSNNLLAKVLNPGALPNILLINSDQYFNQSPWSYIDEEDGLIRYSIDWHQTWYFGSTVRIDTFGVNASGELKLDLNFDDNDGWSYDLRAVTCTPSLN